MNHRRRTTIGPIADHLFVSICMSVLARFIAANQRLSKATEDRLPAIFKRHIQTLYKYKVAELVNRQRGQVVLDIGGGKECPFLTISTHPNRI